MILRRCFLAGLMASAGLSVLAWCGGGGCASSKPPPPLPRPAAAVTLTHFSGTPVSGPEAINIAPTAPTSAPAPSTAPSDALYTVRLIVTEGEIGDRLRSVGADARLMIGTRQSQPVLTMSRLTAGARWADGDEAQSFAQSVQRKQLGRFIELLPQTLVYAPPGVTIELAAVDESPLLAKSASQGGGAGARAGGSPPRRISFFIHPASGSAGQPSDGSIELGLGLRDEGAVAPAPGSGNDASQSFAQASGQNELVLLRPIDLRQRAMCVLAAPFQFGASSSPTKTIVAVIEPAGSAGDDALARAQQRCGQDVERESQRAASRAAQAAASRLAGGASDRPALEAAIAATADPAARRRAIIFLANQTGARISEDVALVADDDMLDKLATQFRKAYDQQRRQQLQQSEARQAGANEILASATMTTQPTTAPAAPTAPTAPTALSLDDTTGWLLDRTCLLQLTAILGDNKLPPELASVLARYAGEAGRNPSSMDQVLKGATGSADLRSRLVAENLVLLEDSSPSSRVRALDWLAQQGRAPAGYDPLAPPRARREALEKALNDASAASASSANGATAKP
jgi:hypothetical protein